MEECISLQLDRFEPEIDSLNELENEDEAKILNQEAEKPQGPLSGTRHSTPIYQMLERIENKVRITFNSKKHHKIFYS